VAHCLGGPLVISLFNRKYFNSTKEVRKCKKLTAQPLKDVPVKTDAGFLIYTDSFTIGQKEGFFKIEDRSVKGVLAGLESTNGQA